RAAWLRPRWLFSRRAAKALLWTVVLAAVAVCANIVGIYLVGSVAGWERWLAAAAGYFLVWRLCLYGATAYGWVWMRRRLLAREDDAQARRRLVRSSATASIVPCVTASTGERPPKPSSGSDSAR
ncbi:hypothetical protein, partial [Pseudomonas aeruginosa]|uniref:hypothetical protein n=1 Tax=Pseudomonas aeruginosa TaxID=287 RepID=UPI003BF5AC40